MSSVQSNPSVTNKLSPKEDRAPAAVLKGSVFTLPILKLSLCDLKEIEFDLTQSLATALGFFNNAPLVIDLSVIRDIDEQMDFIGLQALLHKHQLVPVGVQNGTTEQVAAARKAGFAVLTGQTIDKIIENTAQKSHGKEVSEPARQHQEREREPAPTAHGGNAGAPQVIHQPIRSGQRVYARNSDLILLAAVNAGAEVIADGNIHIYAPLRGRALAGVTGDTEARIFCQCMDAELVAIAGTYRFFEDNIPDDINHKPVQIFLTGDQLNINTLE